MIRDRLLKIDDLPAPSIGYEGWPWTQKTPPLPPTRRDGSPWPRITVVTPSYQQGNFLEETIRSVLLQGYPNLEYFVMDGGSKDDSADIIRKYAPFLTEWVSEKDGGQTNAVNKGLRRGTGSLMGWLNSDDILLPGALQTIAEAFSDSQVMVVTGFRRLMNSKSRILRNGFDGIPTDETLRYECTIAQETTYWRRDIWEKLGDLNEEHRYTLDYEYWQRILHAGYHFTLLPIYLGGFRLHGESKGSTMEDVRQQELARIYTRYGIAQNEADALNKLAGLLGKDWRQKRRILQDLGHFRISNDPRVFIWGDRLLQVPVLSTILVNLHRAYNKRRGRFVYE